MATRYSFTRQADVTPAMVRRVPTLARLIRFEERVKAGEFGEPDASRSDWWLLGLQIASPPGFRFHHAGYTHAAARNTLAIASTGGGGVHYNYLLIDGRLDEDSPIVMCDPQRDDVPLVVLGANLKEFLALGMHRGYDFECLPRSPDEAYLRDESEQTPLQRKILSALAEEFGLVPWTDPARRLRELNDEFAPSIDQPALTGDWWSSPELIPESWKRRHEDLLPRFPMLGRLWNVWQTELRPLVDDQLDGLSCLGLNLTHLRHANYWCTPAGSIAFGCSHDSHLSFIECEGRVGDDCPVVITNPQATLDWEPRNRIVGANLPEFLSFCLSGEFWQLSFLGSAPNKPKLNADREIARRERAARDVLKRHFPLMKWKGDPCDRLEELHRKYSSILRIPLEESFA